MKDRFTLRNLLSLTLLLLCTLCGRASELPRLTKDISDPIIYRIRNTRRAAQGKACYWTMPNGLTTERSEAAEVYFTGVRTASYVRARIHLKSTGQQLTSGFEWADEGTEWYIKEFVSAQGGGYRGVLISNSPGFPSVNNDKMADDGLGCWYVGSSNAQPWLYGGQWDGSIFTLEVDDPGKLGGETLIELPQDQGENISDGASRARKEAGNGYTTYTTDGNICVIVKLYDVDVRDCDYVLIRFAEPCPSKICAAFWSQGGTDNKEIPEGTVEYKYVFADDPKCKVKDGILPQLTLLTLWNVRTVKIAGIYKHSTSGAEDEIESNPLDEAIETLNQAIAEARPYVIGTGLGQYSGTDPQPVITEAENYLKAGECTAEQVQAYVDRLKASTRSLSLNLPGAGAEMRLYCPALKAYVSAPAGASRMTMVSTPTESCTFLYDGRNLIAKASGRFVSTYELQAAACPDEVTFVPAYGGLAGRYTIEFMGGEKERCLQAEAAGSQCNRHFLSWQDGYSTSTQNATAFELQLLSGDVLLTQNMTDRLTNPSFETGDMTGWVYSAVRGDVNAKPNSDSTYKTNGTDGNYLFNTWMSSDSRVESTQAHCAYQTLYGLPEGEYRLEVLASTNQKTGVTLFANSYTIDFIPRTKSTLTEHRLNHIYLTPEMKSMVVGIRSASWFRCDRFQLTYMGKTRAYNEYLSQNYADASIIHPVMLDCFDGQTADGFTYTGTNDFPSTQCGVQNDGTQTDRSCLQLWTANSTTLGSGTLATTYTGLPAGYYKVSTNLRIYDFAGTVNKPVKGLTFYAGQTETAITKGSAPTAGDNKAKGICGEYAVIVQVTDGSLETGFRIGNDCSFNWLGLQNFRLEYLGTTDPTEEILNLNLTEGQYAPLCLPYDITADYYGPIYYVLNVADGQALITPSHEQTLPAGTPCVVKATGRNPQVSINELQIAGGAAGSVLTAWNNTLLQGSYEGLTWTADLADRTQAQACDLRFVEADLSNLDIRATMMNRAAWRFWNENAGYTTSSSSTIGNYLNEPTLNRRDQPNPVIIPVEPASTLRRLYYSTDPSYDKKTTVTIPAKSDKVEIYNLIPDVTHYYSIANTDIHGTMVAQGPLRMIMVGNNVYNVRDLGGKQTVDGRHVSYGKIFRSGELNGGYVATADELKILKNLGIGAEIDLRGEIDNSGAGTSAFGFTRARGNFYYVGGDHYLADEASKMDTSNPGHAECVRYWKEEIEFTVSNLAAGRGVNFHCRIGADRTGCLSLLLEGLLGVQENDLIRNYEVTSFSTAAGTRVKNNTFDTGLKFIKTYQPAGGTLRDAFDAYATKVLGVSQETIEQLRQLMLLTQPEAVGINDIITDPARQQPTAIYDLAGRKVSHPRSGLFIMNGRKVKF